MKQRPKEVVKRAAGNGVTRNRLTGFALVFFLVIIIFVVLLLLILFVFCLFFFVYFSSEKQIALFVFASSRDRCA